MARRNSFSQGRRRRGDRRREGLSERSARMGLSPLSSLRTSSRRLSTEPFRAASGFRVDGHAAKLGRPTLHNWNCTEPLSARPTCRHSATSPTGGQGTAHRGGANRSPQNALQLAAEKEFGAGRQEAAAAAAGRKSQSLWDFCALPVRKYRICRAIFRETDNPVISTGWLVEPDGIEPTTSSMPLKRSPN